MNRREFIIASSIGALGSASSVFGRDAPRRIDVHHHILPPAYMNAIGAGRLAIPVQWSPDSSLQEMDANGVATAVLSLVQPGVVIADVEQGRHLARLANDYGATMVRDHRGRFGLFAALPLLDTDGSLHEIEYALDTLDADGIGLMTSYGGKYLGDAGFAAVYEELNRRHAVVCTHPLSPQCCRNLVPDVREQAIEFPTDTTRTMFQLLLSGMAARFPNIRWIFSHGGGTTPFLVSRLERETQVMTDRETRLPKGFQYELAKFHYDTASVEDAGALTALTKIAPVSQILFGSDYPFRRSADTIAGLTAYHFKPRDLAAIESGNARRLLPNLNA